MDIKESRIMVVDDDPVMRSYVATLLRRLGAMEVMEFEDGELALKALPSVRPDLVMTDIHMPVVGGLELAKRMVTVARGQFRNCPVLLMSSDSRIETLDRATRLSIVGYLVKPPGRDSLERKLTVALAQISR